MCISIRNTGITIIYVSIVVYNAFAAPENTITVSKEGCDRCSQTHCSRI
jgi:hypothetical protein